MEDGIWTIEKIDAELETNPILQMLKINDWRVRMWRRELAVLLLGLKGYVQHPNIYSIPGNFNQPVKESLQTLVDLVGSFNCREYKHYRDGSKEPCMSCGEYHKYGEQIYLTLMDEIRR